MLKFHNLNNDYLMSIFIISFGVVSLNIIKIIFVSIAILYLTLLIVLSIITKRPFKALLYNGILGLFLFVIVDLTSIFTGIWIPINDYTVTISVLGGWPGVMLLIISRFLLFCV